MDFGFDVRKILRPDEFGFSVIRARDTKQFLPDLKRIINTLGSLSATAQGLGAVITTTERFIQSGDNVIYIKTLDNKVVGFLKSGYKHLFHRNEVGRIIEITPLCCLDFYVHESVQRGGFGRELYERMLFDE
jgi:alpha-tubulin N-acetyltransferase 1